MHDPNARSHPWRPPLKGYIPTPNVFIWISFFSTRLRFSFITHSIFNTTAIWTLKLKVLIDREACGLQGAAPALS
eukprot:44423-Amorphochlora_amoeboformis.AAC.1